jgi:hypothetical protein
MAAPAILAKTPRDRPDEARRRGEHNENLREAELEFLLSFACPTPVAQP